MAAVVTGMPAMPVTIRPYGVANFAGNCLMMTSDNASAIFRMCS